MATFRLPATLTGKLSGAATFADGSQTLNVAASAQGRQALAIKQGVGVAAGAPFTLRVSVGGAQIERSGAVARDALLPLLLKR